MRPNDQELIALYDEWIDMLETHIRDIKNLRNQIILGKKENHDE